MKALVLAASDLQTFLISKGWKYCFIGGLAVQQWGEPRLTTDVDVTVLTGFGKEEQYIREFLETYEARIEKAGAFALAKRVLLLRTKDKIDVDVSLGGIPFEESVVLRAKDIELLPNVRLRICSAEDLVVLKAFAGRTKDWMDIEGVLARQGKKKLDWKYIESNLRPLAEIKGEPEVMEKLRRLKRSLNT